MSTDRLPDSRKNILIYSSMCRHSRWIAFNSTFPFFNNNSVRFSSRGVPY